MKGWKYESWRHGLAAKGISTNPKRYFASGTPDIEFRFTGKEARESSRPFASTTQLSGLQAEKSIRTFQRDAIREEAPSLQALRKVQAGDFSDLNKDILAGQRPALIAEANRQAIQWAQAGVDIPEEIQNELTAVTKSQIKDIKAKNLKEGRSAGAALGAAAGKGLATKTEQGIRAVGSAGIEGGFKESSASQASKIAADQNAFVNATDSLRQNTSVFGNLNKAGVNFDKTPGTVVPVVDITDNVFFGDNDRSIGKDEDNGAFDFISDPVSKTAPMSSAIVPKEKFKGVDFGTGDVRKSFSENLSEQVESLWSARHSLGEVDKKPLQKGERAFNSGNREKLIEAINEQEFQVKQQESRWRLVEQTRQEVESSQNRQSIFNDTSSSPFSFSMFSGGGDKIVDETKKITEVKKSVKQGADDARGRSANLRGKLQRLDSTVPPEESLPEKQVKVFKPSFSFMGSMDNPVMGDE